MHYLNIYNLNGFVKYYFNLNYLLLLIRYAFNNHIPFFI